MKSLQKLRLINWHYFTNTTVDIKNITFLTGPNGTGKSTVIDALQILILGTTRPDNFNKAANEKGRSGRNLLSYLRGQTGIGDDGKTITIRPGTFTSYIAIEIFDDVENRTFTLGVVFDVADSDSIDKHYFWLDSPFPENGFANNAGANKIRPMMYKELSQYVRSEYKAGHFRFFDTDADYQTFSKEAFGNLPDKYFALFKKAVSFAPISDISSFITNYICDADINVDITPMQKNIEQYKLMELEAKRLKVKQESLTKIKNSYDNYHSYKISLDMLTYVNTRACYEEANNKLQSFSKKLADKNHRLLEIADDLETFDAQLEELDSDYASYQAKKLQSKHYSLTERLSGKKDGIAQKITSIQMQVSNVVTKLNNYAHDYYETCSSFASYYSNFNAARLKGAKDAFNNLYEIVNDISYEAKDIMSQIDNDSIDFDSVKAFRNDMEALRQEATSLKGILNQMLYEVSRNLNSLQQDLQNVNSGKKPFDQIGPNYSIIRQSLEDALRARHSDAYVNIYCDLVDITDPEWTKALEAVLFSQKFNFFVNPRYYEEANRIMKELCDTYHYYRISLVDTERLLNADIVANDDSIANLIVTDDEGARAYTDYLLGRIKKCSSFEEARRSGSGLCSDCTGYRGYATWYLNKDNARISFLGTKVSNDTKAISANEYKEMNSTYSLISEALNKLQSLLSLPVMSPNECETYQEDINKTNEIPMLKKQIEEVENDMKTVAKGDMSDIDKKLQEIDEDRKRIRADRESRLTERGTVLEEVRRLNAEDIPLARANAEDYSLQLRKFDEKIVNEEYDPFYSRLIDEQGMSLAQIKNQATRDYIQIQNKQNSELIVLKRLRNDYCSEYHLNYDVSNIDSNGEFERELENISKVMLPDYEEKIERAHEASIKEFKDDFIYKLRTSIETVYAQIDELNQTLQDCHFGRDIYQFKVTPNRDYIEYYNMIMDPLLLQAGDAEALFMEKYKRTMDDLFTLISSSTSASGEQKEQVVKNIEMFTSYTTYILFDLLVKRGSSEDWISLGRSFKSQSGGETQTPFYIAILASFASLCRANNRKDNNTLRLVIFDEAFSKMDSARILQSADLLRQFGLQAILSTPSEKLRDLVSYVDIILVAIHDERRKRSYLDVYQDKSKTKPENVQVIEELPPAPPEAA